MEREDKTKRIVRRLVSINPGIPKLSALELPAFSLCLWDLEDMVGFLLIFRGRTTGVLLSFPHDVFQTLA